MELSESTDEEVESCVFYDLAMHSFSKGLCVYCGKTPLELAAITTGAMCKHAFNIADVCDKCGCSVEVLKGGDVNLIGDAVLTKWFCRGDKKLVTSYALESTLAELNLLKGMSEEFLGKLRAELDASQELVPLSLDPYPLLRMYIRGILLYAVRYASKIKEAMDQPGPSVKSGPVMSRTIVSVGRKKR